METQTEIAKRIAIKAHKGQVRKLGEDKDKPYIIHPERVASNFTNDMLCAAALLHDVLEDCPGYSTRMLHDPTEKYLNYLIKIAESDEASMIKMADLLDNLKSCPPGSRRDKYELARHILLEGR